MDVGGWLRKLGLEEYEAAFRENRIDDTVLPRLTAEDLKDLGVAFVGDRRRLLDAIAALNAEAGAPAPALSDAPPAIDKGSKDTAERRQVTVMFSDLVGSTALSARLDPEDLREVISAYQRCVAETVRPFGGFVARYLGDGVLIYFGYPAAHEDDAERAVRSGLALIDAVAALPALEPLPVRIGAATGMVVVGDLVGAGEAQEHDIVGETPNLAARLQAIAEPNTVVIAEATRRLLGSLFELQDLGPKELKGIAGPVRVFAVLRASSVESRFEAMHPGDLTALIGREEELELLLRRWASAKTGEGQVLLLSGEAGIGKSRLSAALMERLAAEPYTRLRYFGSPHHTDSALHPFIAQLERAAGFKRDDDPPTRLDKLDALLSRTATLAEDRRLIADLLMLRDAKRLPALDLSSQQRKQRTLEALVRQLERLARRHPVLTIFEDAHWIDPTSLELMDRTIERIRRWPVLLLMTFRPEFHPPWIGQAHVTMVTLNRLNPREGVEIVERIAGSSGLPMEVINEIVERTDGVPLFVEELTKAVLEAGPNDSNTIGAVASVPMPALAVPATLHASLMARLDRLGPTTKEVVQVGAAVGREFSYELLAAVAQRTDVELRTALEQLVEAGLAFCRGLPPQASYLFKHALVQDAAYGTLLRTRRQELHGRIATVLEERFPEMVDQQPELLAHHCAQAGWVEKAIAYWGRAGRQSLARSAMIESAAQVRKGLDLLAHLPEDPGRWRQELELQRVLGAALIASKGNAAPETLQAYARARELCERLGDTAGLIPVLGALSTYHQVAGEYAAMRRISEDLLRIGEQQGHTAGSLVGSRSMGLCLYHLGEFVAARSCLERVLDLYTPEVHDALVAVTSFDVRTAALSYQSMILGIQGQPKQAAVSSRQALTVSKNLRNPHNLAFSLNYAVLSGLLRRIEPATEELLDELRSLAIEHRFPVWLATANIMRGYVLAGRDETGAGLALARKGWADWKATRSKYHETYYLGLLAQTCERADQTDEALDLIDTALATADRMGERWFEAELHRLQGEWLAAHRRKERQRSEACFHRAIDVAQSQDAKMFELRASTSLARLWRDQGIRTEARDLLAPIYGWFTEGFDTRDLKEAKALLDELM
jgi:class 3 adenylate cyclase/predicted ATPase